ncbi:glycerol-3-phosphate ABC transporter ATP-binding protein [Floricoccus penangensis]|uniref:Glycerol-3-phosphate ABC transporter ATP-binding protein n=1 Tax=Floricoccus penangensis TaxID=1859475 RepID=A0A9Q5NZW1_9LACT|nr:ABC transporter ATP-binding protein [Floricoccus penangensis]OFI46247.1 glycerol-3-phosphate ABC transporter ATP-binding protein [Floricoccus penangensis]
MYSIELKNLSKSFDGQENILSDISLNILSEEFFVLVGPSGCGKSTLLRMIAGLEQVEQGSIYLQGEDVSQFSPQQRKISMVFQNYALFPHMTVRENILFGLDNKSVSSNQLDERLKTAVEMTNLDNYLDRKPKQLSGGQRQRVALARAIASRRAICLMDEPLSNLDAELREKMRTQIKNLQRELKMTIVYVTHDQTEAMTMGDRIAVLNKGIIQQVGKPLELYNNPQNTFVAGFIGTPRMNLLNLTKINNQIMSDGKTIVVDLDNKQLESLEKHRKMTVGVRPEHFEIASKEDSNLSAEIINIEQLGDETILIFNVEGQQLLAKLDGQHLLNVGDQINLKIKQNELHFFDGLTDKRIVVGGNEVNED